MMDFNEPIFYSSSRSSKNDITHYLSWLVSVTKDADNLTLFQIGYQVHKMCCRCNRPNFIHPICVPLNDKANFVRSIFPNYAAFELVSRYGRLNDVYHDKSEFKRKSRSKDKLEISEEGCKLDLLAFGPHNTTTSLFQN